MKEICIIPTFERPAMLAVCLEALRSADPSIDLHVFPDRGTNQREICEKFGAIHHLGWQHTYHGNSFVMLEALKWANSQSCAMVYVVEDDCVVMPNFFKWCRAAIQKHPGVFAACGWKYSPQALIGDGPDILMPWYLSVCAAIPKHNLVSIVQHARPEYYSEMREYLDLAYPGSIRRGTKHYEQDGCILRVLESQNKRCVWPRVPKATHIGWHGYHMSGKPFDCSLEDSIQLIKLALKSPTMLSVLMSGGALPKLGHCDVCKKLLISSSDLLAVCIECFHGKYTNLAVTSSSHYYLRNQL